MIRPLVVFDLDGTLVDSQQDLADAANALIVELGGTPVPVEAIAKMVGDGAAMLVRRALTATGVRVTSLHDALERFLELYDDRLLATTRLYDGIPDVLDELGPMARLGVLTNKPERATHRILEALGVAVRFEWMIGGDGPFARKPDPAGLLHLVADAGVSPDRAVMVGDSGVDLATARAAHTRVCLARYGFGFRLTSTDLTGDELIADTPLAILAHLKQSFF
jgi:phosphoglycolate phosphatase